MNQSSPAVSLEPPRSSNVWGLWVAWCHRAAPEAPGDISHLEAIATVNLPVRCFRGSLLLETCAGEWVPHGLGLEAASVFLRHIFRRQTLFALFQCSRLGWWVFLAYCHSSGWFFSLKQRLSRYFWV